MNSLDSLKIDLKSLDQGEMKMECSLDDEFFHIAESGEVKGGNVQLFVSAHKSVSGLYEIDFHAEGMVKVACDLCLDDMDQPICTDNRLLAKLGEEYSEDEDIVTVDKDEAILDTAWFVYESIVLDIPIKHVHAPGKCNPAMIKALEEHSPARSGEEENQQITDPRWSELKKLKSIIKD